MKSLIYLVLLVAMITFCNQAEAIVDCTGKFQLMKTGKMETLKKWKNTPEELANLLCEKLGYDQKNSDLNNCFNDHLPYFKEIRVSSDDIKAYAEYCNRYQMKSEKSKSLMFKLKEYCWTLADISKISDNLYNKDVRITPDDWNRLQFEDELQFHLCLDSIASDASIKDNKIGLFEKYQKYVGNVGSCNCVEVIQLEKIFDKFKTETDDIQTFYRDVCLKSEKGKNTNWKKEQLEVVEQSDITDKSLNIDLKIIARFLVVGVKLSSYRWYDKDETEFKNTRWKLVYILKHSLDKNNIDAGRIDTMAKAMYFGYTTDMFDEFIKITSITEKSNTVNSWTCRRYIITLFFNDNRILNFRRYNFDNLNYKRIGIPVANQHIKLLLDMKPPGQTCLEFCGEIYNIVDGFYKNKINGNNLTELFNLAKECKQSLDNTYKCLNFISKVESEIIRHDLLNRPDIIDKEYEERQEAAFQIYRKEIFKTTKNYALCENSDRANLNTKSKENLIALFKHLFKINHEIQDLNDVLKIENSWITLSDNSNKK